MRQEETTEVLEHMVRIDPSKMNKKIVGQIIQLEGSGRIHQADERTRKTKNHT